MDARNVIDERAFLVRIKDLGLADDPHAAQASLATIRALGELLPVPERGAFTSALPPSLAGALAPFHGPMAAEQFFDRVRLHEGISAGFAREHAEIVCRVLGEMLPEEVMLRMRRALAPSVEDLFNPPEPPPEPPLYAVLHGERHHTLATGVPGSHHPVSESAPPAGQPDSVVATDDPHGDRKLSGATGLTQEQTDESLATEVPRTDRTIAESHD